MSQGDTAFDKFFALVQDLWPRTRVTAAELRTSVWDGWGRRIPSDDMAAALRAVRELDPDATRPTWKLVRADAYKLRGDDRPETEQWVRDVTHIRDTLGKNDPMRKEPDERLYRTWLEQQAHHRRLYRDQTEWLRSRVPADDFAIFLQRTIANVRATTKDGANGLAAYYRQIHDCAGRTCDDCTEGGCALGEDVRFRMNKQREFHGTTIGDPANV